MAVLQSHGETRRQRLHLQLSSGKTHNGKQVGAHGSLHHLRKGGDFGFLERIPVTRRGVGHPLTTHICTVCSQARNAHHALKSHGLQCHLFVRLKIVLPSGVARVSSLVDSLAYHYEQVIFPIHSSFYHDTRARSTTGTTRSTPRTPNAS